MKFVFRPICWAIGLGESAAAGIMISGHNYVQQKSYEKDGKVYEPLKCKRCGHVSIGWYDKNDPPPVI